MEMTPTVDLVAVDKSCCFLQIFAVFPVEICRSLHEVSLIGLKSVGHHLGVGGVDVTGHSLEMS